MANILYRITNITTGMGLNDAKQLVEQVIVSYQTQFGDTGTVRMDKTLYTAESMKELIDAEVSEHNKLRGV